MFSEKPPTAWVIAEIGGKVLSAHCNYMAGLGEACSHVGAILFYCRAATEKKEVSYKEVSDIDFSFPNISQMYIPGPEKKIKEVSSSSTPTEMELQDCTALSPISKPLSANIPSPDNKYFIIPHLSVKCLSGVLPPHAFDTKLITP